MQKSYNHVSSQELIFNVLGEVPEDLDLKFGLHIAQVYFKVRHNHIWWLASINYLRRDMGLSCYEVLNILLFDPQKLLGHMQEHFCFLMHQEDLVVVVYLVSFFFVFESTQRCKVDHWAAISCEINLVARVVLIGGLLR